MSEESKPSLLSVKDLAGLSAPLTKLIETVGAGGGRLADGVRRVVSTYWLAGKDAHNEAERIRLVERARTQVLGERAKMLGALASSPQRELKGLDISAQGEVSVQLAGIPSELQDLHERSIRRAAYENMAQQLNWDAVTEFAADALAEETTVAQEPVNPDWTTRLRSISQDVSSEDMQALWGKILAGEIKQPGSFSLRTLEVLKNLSQEEALLFTEACNYVLTNFATKGHAIMLYMGPHDKTYLHEFLKYGKILTLTDCGLIVSSSEQFATSKLANESGFSRLTIRIGQYAMFCVKESQEQQTVFFKYYKLTQAGEELYQLLKPITPLAFFLRVGKDFQAQGFTVSYAPFKGVLADSLDIIPPILDLSTLEPS